MEVMNAHLEGQQHTLRSLSNELGISYSSVCRIVYAFTSEARPGGVLKLLTDSTDRRRKVIEVDQAALKKNTRTLEKAMLSYYGQSVYKLKRKS